jgi:hypothetical protein
MNIDGAAREPAGAAASGDLCLWTTCDHRSLVVGVRAAVISPCPLSGPAAGCDHHARTWRTQCVEAVRLSSCLAALLHRGVLVLPCPHQCKGSESRVWVRVVAAAWLCFCANRSGCCQGKQLEIINSEALGQSMRAAACIFLM